jgi:membrane associated rhomboid family serine protease
MFIVLPMGVDYHAKRYPVVTFTLIGINTVIYLAGLVWMLTTGFEAQDWIIENLWLIPEKSLLHTYVTTLFVHGGLLHLVGNMIYLFLFGGSLEDLIGRGKFLVFYLIGGLAAVFMHIAVVPGGFSSDLPLGGASGAVSACIGGFVLLLHDRSINFKYLIFTYGGSFSLPAWLVISFWFLWDLMSAVIDFLDQDSGGGVAFAAHVGGFVAGFAMILAHKYLRRPPEAMEAIPALAATVGDMDDVASIYLFDGMSQAGPFTPGQVRQMLALGSIAENTCYWQEGMEDWRDVAELAELYRW